MVEVKCVPPDTVSRWVRWVSLSCGWAGMDFDGAAGDFRRAAGIDLFDDDGSTGGRDARLFV